MDEDDFEKEIDETSELKIAIQERIINIELAIKTDSSESEDDNDLGRLQEPLRRRKQSG